MIKKLKITESNNNNILDMLRTQELISERRYYGSYKVLNTEVRVDVVLHIYIEENSEKVCIEPSVFIPSVSKIDWNTRVHSREELVDWVKRVLMNNVG